MGHVVDYTINLHDKFNAVFGKFYSGMDRINKKMQDFGHTANLVNKVSGSISIAGRNIDGLNERLSMLVKRRNAAFDEIDIKRYNAAIKDTQKELQRLENLPPDGFFARITKMKSGLGKMLPMVGAAAGVAGLVNFNNQSIETAANVESMTNAIRFASIDTDDFTRNMSFLKDNIVGKLKMPVMETYEGFKTLSGAMMGTKLQGQGARDVFESVSMGARVMGLSAADVQGTFIALGQMMSKGKISAEEMSQQLGERLPGALNISARAMGVSKSELMKMMAEGKLMAEDFLPRFAQEMRRTYEKGIPDAMESTRSKMDELNNKQIETRLAWAETFGPLNKKLRELRIGALQALINGFNSLKNIFQEIRPVAEAIGMTLLALSPILAAVGIWANWNAIAFGLWTVKYYAWIVATKIATAVQWLFNAAMWANPLTWVIAAVIAMVAALIILYMKVDKVRGFIWALWESIKELGSIIYDFFAGVWEAMTTGDTSRLKNAFKAGERLSKAWAKGMDDGINSFNADKLQQKLDSLNPANAGAGGGGDITNDISENITSGGSRPTNITLNLGKLHDNIIIHSATLKEGVDEMEKIVAEALLRVLNSGNAVATGGGG
jgi:tape measure domain-containing protein